MEYIFQNYTICLWAGWWGEIMYGRIAAPSQANVRSHHFTLNCKAHMNLAGKIHYVNALSLPLRVFH